MNTQELQTVDIPLKKLLAWEENVRTTTADEGLQELTASIRSLGLLQSLVVKKAPRGKFAVVAGKRRLQALSRYRAIATIGIGRHPGGIRSAMPRFDGRRRFD